MVNENELVKDYIPWTGKVEHGEAFLMKLVGKVDAGVKARVTTEEWFRRDVLTLHLSKEGRQTTMEVSYEELINCNSIALPSAALSQQKLVERIKRQLGEINEAHRKLVFLK